MLTLINLPSQFLIDDRVMPPLGVLYLATYVREHGMDCNVLDLAGVEDYTTTLLDGIRDSKVVGISCTTPQFIAAKDVLWRIRCEYPDTIVAIGGPHATVDPESCYQFDHVVRGEGERALLNINEWIHTDTDSYIKYQHIEDIDDIPHPDRSLIDITKYSYELEGEPCTTLITSRGCPWGNCSFCSTREIWGKAVRTHSPEYVHSEVKYLKSLGYRALMFFDDVFVYPRSRVMDITRRLAAENIIYRCFIRPDTSEAVLKAIRGSGCIEVGVGIESGSQAILDTINKCSTVENNTRLVDTIHRLGMRVKTFMILGLPGESPETAQETYQWLKDVRPDDFDISLYKPYKGSPITKNPKEYDIVIDDHDSMWYKGRNGEYTSSVHTSNMSAVELVEARDRIERELKGVQ